MFCYVKDQFCYLVVNKNASTTYANLLSDHGWQRRDLFANDLDLKNMILWGHIQDPEARHTKGLATYLLINSEIDYLNPSVAKLLVTGVFDTHTYSISMMLGPVWNYPIHWIPLDYTFTDFSSQTFKHLRRKYDSNQLTQIWFHENGIDVDVDDAIWLNRSHSVERQIRDTINYYKYQHQEEYGQLIKNFLTPDIIQYRKTVNEYARKFGSTENLIPPNIYED
jgi:hypothetical protein